MVTNQPLDEIKQELERAQKKDIHIEIEPNISTSVNYLDLTITNENGQLKTTIYHKPTAELYYLPYTSDHPHRYHRNIPYNALLRAARLCSNINDFNFERLRIDMSLLLSNYPLQLILNQFLRFFQVNNAAILLKQLNEQVYQSLHQNLLHRQTAREKKINQSKQDPIKNPLVLQKQSWDKTLMYPKYTFQSGPMTKFSHEFFQWWQKYYQYIGSPVNNVKVRLIPKTNRTLESFPIHKKPPSEILTRMEPTKN